MLPRIGSRLGLVFAFSSAKCSAVTYVRRKEDPWNSTIGVVTTAGFLNIRSGLGAASNIALVAALFLGGMLMLDNAVEEESVPNIAGVPVKVENSEQAPSSSSSSSSSWFGGFLVVGRSERGNIGTGSKTEVLENSDAPNLLTLEF